MRRTTVSVLALVLAGCGGGKADPRPELPDGNTATGRGAQTVTLPLSRTGDGPRRLRFGLSVACPGKKGSARMTVAGRVAGIEVPCGGPQYVEVNVPAGDPLTRRTSLKVRIRTRPAGLRWAVGVS